jgi:hypothetical protein
MLLLGTNSFTFQELFSSLVSSSNTIFSFLWHLLQIFFSYNNFFIFSKLSIVGVVSYYNIASCKLPFPISHCFVALFFIFCHGQNAKEGKFVHNVMHAPIPNYGQGSELFIFWVFIS